MLDHHPFGVAGGAGCIDDVRQIGRTRAARRVLRRLIVTHGGEVTDAQLAIYGGAHGGGRAGLVRQQDVEPGVREHEGLTLARIRRIDGNVRATRLEDPEDANDHPVRAVNAQPDEGVGAYVMVRREIVRNAVCPRVQLGIGNPLVFVEDRDVVWARLDLQLEDVTEGSRGLW